MGEEKDSDIRTVPLPHPWPVYLMWAQAITSWRHILSHLRLIRLKLYFNSNVITSFRESTTDLKGNWLQMVDFLPFLIRETTSVTSWLLSCTSNPFWKGVCSKRKEFASRGNIFFPLRVDSFSEGNKTILIIVSFVSESIPFKCKKCKRYGDAVTLRIRLLF